MKKNPIFVCSVIMAILAPIGANGAEFASAREAEAMVAKAVAAIKASRQATYDEITAKNPKWIDRDLYPVVYSISGKVLAHGQNQKQVGREMIDAKDSDGREFVRERVDLARTKGKFWHDYRFTDPVSKRPLPKQAYCEILENTVVCAGIYKRN